MILHYPTRATVDRYVERGTALDAAFAVCLHLVSHVSGKLPSVAGAVSKSQIDKLGDRLRSGNVSDEDLVMLDAYRRSFSAAYETTVTLIERSLEVPISGRPSKSTPSIIEKLKRETARLSQIQDIAGCRIVVADLFAQDTALKRLTTAADAKGLATAVFDRRDKPSFGYRAVHVILYAYGRWVEIQIRTELQHVWAQLSEKLSDVYDPAIKYGGGSPVVRQELDKLSSRVVANYESALERVRSVESSVRKGDYDELTASKLADVLQELHAIRMAIRDDLYQTIADIVKQVGDDIPDPVQPD